MVPGLNMARSGQDVVLALSKAASVQPRDMLHETMMDTSQAKAKTKKGQTLL